MGIVIKQSVKSSIYSYFGIAIGFLNTILLFPKMLSLEEIGLFKLLLSFCIILNPLIQFNAAPAITKYFHFYKHNKQEFNSFISFILLLPVIGFLLFLLIALIGKTDVLYSLFNSKSQLFVDYSYYLFPLVFFFVFSNVLESLILTQLKSVFLTFLKNVLLRLLNTLIVVLYFYDYLTQNQLIGTFVITYAIQFLILFIYFIKISSFSWENPKFTFKNKEFKPMLSYLLLIFMGGSSAAIVSQIDSIMSSYKLGLNYTGIYSIAFFIAVVIEIPRRNIIQIISPLLTKALKEDNHLEIKNIYQKTAINQFIVSALVFLLLAFNLPEIYSFFPKNENFALIQQGMPVVLIVGASFVFDMLMGCNTELIHFSRIYYWNAILIPILALSAIGFNLYFMELMDNGLLAIAYATLLTFLVHNCIRCAVIYYYFKILPFTLGHLKLLLIILLTWGVLYFIPSFDSVLLNLSLKSSLIILLFSLGVIGSNTSPEVSLVYQNLKKKFLPNGLKND